MITETIEISSEIYEEIMSDWGRRRNIEENISALLDNVLGRCGISKQDLIDQSITPSPEVRTKTHPDGTRPKLERSKVVGLTLDGEAVLVRTWKDVLFALVRFANEKGASLRHLSQVGVNFVAGRQEEKGFQYLPDLQISVQAKSAEASMRVFDRLSAMYGSEFVLHITIPDDGHIQQHVIRSFQTVP